MVLGDYNTILLQKYEIILNKMMNLLMKFQIQFVSLQMNRREIHTIQRDVWSIEDD